MNSINAKTISNPLSNNEMKGVLGGRQEAVFFLYCIDYEGLFNPDAPQGNQSGYGKYECLNEIVALCPNGGICMPKFIV